MKKMLSVLLAFTIMVSSALTMEVITGSPIISASASAASYSTGVYRINHSNGVNVRKGAGTSYSRVGAASYGVEFTVTEVKYSGGYTWGYTPSIRCTNGTRSGWLTLNNCKLVSSSVTPQISFNNMKFAIAFKQGLSKSISGTITSTANIDSITVNVTSDISGCLVLTKTVYPNSQSYNLAYSTLDYGLKFGTLSAGTYKLQYVVKSGSSTKYYNHAFVVVANESTSTAKLDLNKSLEYAATYWYNYNSAYDKGYRSNDCANFVSQILVAGGLATDSTWCRGSVSFLTVDGIKRYLHNTYGVVTYMRANYSACSCNDFVKVNTDLGISDIAAGDIIITRGSSGNDGHVMFVSKVSGGRVYAYGHSNDRNGQTYSVSVGYIQGVIKTSALYQ